MSKRKIFHPSCSKSIFLLFHLIHEDNLQRTGIAVKGFLFAPCSLLVRDLFAPGREGCEQEATAVQVKYNQFLNHLFFNCIGFDKTYR